MNLTRTEGTIPLLNGPEEAKQGLWLGMKDDKLKYDRELWSPIKSD